MNDGPDIEAQCRLVVDTSNQGIWLADRAGRTTFVNPRISELLGFAAAEMLGAPIAAFVAQRSDGADDRAVGAHAAFTRCVGTAEAGAFEICFRHKDGSTVWTRTSIQRMPAVEGRTPGIIVTVVDGTERRRSRLALADSEHQYQLLAEAMPHSVFTADARGETDYCNQTWYEYSGLTAQETIGRGWARAFHPGDVAHGLAAWNAAMETGQVYETEARIRRAADGMYRWFILRAVPVHDAAGAVVRWIGSCADIHDFKIASETRSVLDTMGHIISIRNDDGTFAYVSPSWSVFAGTAAESSTASDWHTFVHPDDRAIIDFQDRASRESPLHVQQNEIRLRGPDDKYHWFLARTVALADTDGMPRRRLNTLTDIDDLKQIQAAFGKSETRYRALTDAMPQMVWIIDEDAQLEYVNERWLTYTGLAFVPGSTGIAAVVHPDDRTALAAKHTSLLAGQDFECEVRMQGHDGVYRWHLLRTVPLGAGGESAPRWIVTATDIEARKSTEAALANSAHELIHRTHHDALTNLPNRARLMGRLTQLIADAKHQGTDIVVLYIDIDRFKTINDTLGHNAGDAALIQTGRRINSILRSDDIASRFGGDEFVLVCAAAGAGDAARIAERVQQAVCAPSELNGRRVGISCSIGISVFPQDGSTADDLIQKADSAMYAAKESGRNTWCLYSKQNHLRALPALELETELREAIAGEQFVVFYQPIVSVESGRAIGAEALVRWAHPERGLLPPGEFISFAENHGLISAIGEIVLHAACAQLKRLKLRASDAFSIAVNVSARQFAKPGFVGTIASIIEAHGLDARRLEIEITESVVMSDTAAVTTTLDQLKALGVKLSLDDFGTGYSSLAYIKNFPIHTLKIDRSFVVDIATSFTDQAIAKTIVTLAHSLGMRVVAEGVETTEQLELLRTFGADCTQGYLFSRPLAPADFEQFMTGRRTVTR